MMSRAVPVIVGLTGSIGMGKSTASAWCRKVGIPVHDADACVHSLYGPGGAAVQPVGAAFPGVASDAGIDRAALSAAVAAAGRETALKTLEGIVHPLVTTDREAFVAQAAADGAWCVVLDIPLLFETMDPEARTKDLDALVVISAPAEIQRARVLARPGMTEEKFAFLLSKQVPDATKRAAADYVIETGFDSYAPARAQLAACFQALAAKHTEPYTRWMTSGMPLPPPRRLPPLPPPLLPPPATKIRAVTMDLDDTCWPTFPPILKASAALESDMAELLPRAAAAGCGDRGALKASMTEVQKEQPLLVHDMSALRRAALAKQARTHGDDPGAPVDELMRRFVLARSDVKDYFFSDTAASLQALRRAGLTVGACTNGNCDVRLHAEVVEFFDFTVSAGDAGATKPSAAPFWMAAHAAGCRPSEMVHVGDDVVTDLKGALDAGFRAVLVSRADLLPRKPQELEVLETLEKDPARWREVASLEEMVQVVREWREKSEVDGP